MTTARDSAAAKNGASPTETSEAHLDIAGRVVRVSNPDRVLWPRTGFTKAQMIDYYRAVSTVMLPHIARRGITLRRFPESVDGPGWYQANCRGHPSWMSTLDITGKGGETLRYCRIEDEAALVWAANLGTIEIHPFLATVDRPSEPTVLVVDLDPGPPASIVASARVALLVRDVLAPLALEAFPKTSGSVGMHVYVPLAAGHTFERTKAFARALGRVLARRAPELVIDRVSRAERANRVFIDWIQNDESRSTVAPYSLRATPWPLVSTPVTWAEVEAAAASGRAERLLFGPSDVRDRVDRLGDLFAPVLTGSGVLPDPSTIGDAG
ncbi:MAG: non-homologous end-joining DNA ligase [Chloroflexota bacterium]